MSNSVVVCVLAIISRWKLVEINEKLSKVIVQRNSSFNTLVGVTIYSQVPEASKPIQFYSIAQGSRKVLRVGT